MSDTKAKREKLLDSLYRHCQIRTSTSKEVFDKIVFDTGLIGTSEIKDQAIEIIRPYKNTGINLESTLDALYDLLYPTKTTTSTTTGSVKTEIDWDDSLP